MMMVLAYAISGIVPVDESTGKAQQLNPYEKWQIIREDMAESLETSPELTGSSPEKYSSLDGPYPTSQDDGRPNGDTPGETPFWGEYCITNTVCYNIFSGANLYVSDGGGDFVVGEGHEYYLGDQNGDGNLEWVVFYFYIPWMSDGLDNDGDGCVDEIGGTCDIIPDAMVIYETGGLPEIGGIDGTLLMNHDYYSGGGFEIYRAFVSTPWHAYRIRAAMFYPDMAGEFISYYAREAVNEVNANPEMDSDFDDWYVGSIDTRRFPDRPPTNSACSAGWRGLLDTTFMRDDGWTVTSYSLVESYDSFDWNGDGDTRDYVAAYYAINPNTGDCRIGVNSAVYGRNPRNTGYIMIPDGIWEPYDGRDWNGNEVPNTVQLYHNINSTWSHKGPIYRSYTYNPLLIARQKFGFGWWGTFSQNSLDDVFPFRAGGAFERSVGAAEGYVKTFYFHVSDEDGDRATPLPEHLIGYGSPTAIHGGKCVQVTAYEYRMDRAGVQLVFGIADGNGDGDISDVLTYIFCPHVFGSGGYYVIDNTSKYALGLYWDPIPFLWSTYFTIHRSFEIAGVVTVPLNIPEVDVNLDCDLDGTIDLNICSSYYQYNL
jgi:hypothetical protein